MKKRKLLLMTSFVLICSQAYAGNGDLIVSGNEGIGTTNPTSYLAGTSGITVYNSAYPGVSLANANNYWLWYMDGNDLRLFESSNDRVTFQKGGYVGVGTTNPSSPLEVVGNNNWANGWRHGIKITSNDYPTLRLHALGSGKTSFIGNDNDGGLWFGINGSDTAYGAYGMVLQPSGNVGIGTMYPASALEVVGNSNWASGWRHGLKITSNDYPTLRFHALGSGKTSFIGNDNDGGLWFGINGSDSVYGAYGMVILPSGNIGVGTMYPTSKLHVNGSFAATVKNFDIKDPRYNDGKRRLIHASIEGPEVGVYYRGEAKLESGRATVTLPPYFEALTSKENRTVLLTLKFEQEGEALCNVAASGVKNGEFTIRAFGVPDLSACRNKVYWEVKAERSDVGKINVEEIREDYPEKEPKKQDKDSDNISNIP